MDTTLWTFGHVCGTIALAITFRRSLIRCTEGSCPPSNIADYCQIPRRLWCIIEALTGRVRDAVLGPPSSMNCHREGCATATHAAKTTSTLPELSELENQQKIAALAYEFWLARAFRRGSPETDWLRADRTIRGKPGTVSLRRTAAGNFLVS